MGGVTPIGRRRRGARGYGDAHAGTERGLTPAGIRVGTVAQPVLDGAYRVVELPDPESAAA